MHISFKSISLQRFRSFSQATTLDLPACGNGLYYLKGKNKDNTALGANGVGKSTIVDAFLWCLYGRTVQGLRNTDITPWSGKGQTIVSVKFTIDNKEHKIRRTANPNLLQLDNAECGQETIDKLLQLPLDIVPYTIILGQRRPLFFDLAPKAKLDLFTTVLNLDKWDNYSKHASDQVAVLERNFTRAQDQLISLEGVATTFAGNLNSLKEKSKIWEDDRVERLQSHESQRKKYTKMIAAIMGERDSADLQLDGALTELKAIQPKLEDLYNSERKLTKQITDQKHKAEIQKAAIEHQQGVLASLNNNQSCPTCQQPIKSAAKVKELKRAAEKTIHDTLNESYADARSLDHEELKGVTTAIDSLQSAETKFLQKQRDADEVFRKLEPKLAEYNAQIKALDKLKNEQESNNNPYNEQIQSLRKQIDSNKKETRTLNESLTANTEKCERASFWIKGFKEIKLYVIEEILQELELATNSMCDEFGLVNWKVTYDIELETKSGTVSRGLNVTVLSPSNKRAVRWECWSGGEGQRLRIIGALALSSVLLNHAGVSVDLEILDEPTGSLSSEGIRDLVESLAYRARSHKKNIWMIDHHLIENSHFVDSILVVKDKTGSYIE